MTSGGKESYTSDPSNRCSVTMTLNELEQYREFHLIPIRFSCFILQHRSHMIVAEQLTIHIYF